MRIEFTNDVNRRLLYAIHTIFEHGADRANNRIGDTADEKRSRSVLKDGGYKCIHLDPARFCDMIGAVLDHQKIHSINKIPNLKFIDIGCGVGEKIYLANLFGLQSFGLELRKELIKEGKKLLTSMGFGSCHWSSDPAVVDCFIQGNALTYDYKDFDILYFYCPLVNGELQIKLEQQIARTAKPGAIVIPASARGCFYWGNVRKDLPKDWQFTMVNDTGYFVREA